MHGMQKPELSRMQRAWLQELGIDSRMLAHFSAAPFGEDASAPAAVPASSQAAAPAPASPRTRTHSPARPHTPAPTPARTGAPAPTRAPADTPANAHASARARVAASPGPAPTDAALATVPADISLAELRERVEACQNCGLHEVRGHPVFGEGVEQAPQWMLIGEAPGEYDDSTGRPFQGRAGELLQAMLASAGIDPATQVYFANALKCRPMGNRSPEAGEIDACMPLLRRQITLIRPGCLVALGRVAAMALLGSEAELDALRSTVHEYVDEEGRRIPLVVTHHPASLLLHARLKADAWRDLNLLRDL